MLATDEAGCVYEDGNDEGDDGTWGAGENVARR